LLVPVWVHENEHQPTQRQQAALVYAHEEVEDLRLIRSEDDLVTEDTHKAKHYTSILDEYEFFHEDYCHSIAESPEHEEHVIQ
jgi:hypothetical protein